MSTTPTQAASTMKQYGGSFARALAEAWFAADTVNQQRIEQAFPDFFLRYAALSETVAEGA